MSFKGDVNQIPAREGAILVNFQSRDLNLGYQSQSVTVHSGSISIFKFTLSTMMYNGNWVLFILGAKKQPFFDH